MTSHIRRQLTLLADPQTAAAIERFRQQYNPAQAALITAHVTLCREDEIEQLELVLHNLCALRQAPVTVTFGKPERFDSGKGLWLPAAGENNTFHKLRKKILAGIADNPRLQTPHITLMHPRNSACTDDIFAQAAGIHFPAELTFAAVSLIEQAGGGPWHIVQQFELLPG